MKHEGAERERDVTGGHYNSGVVGSRTRSNGSLIFPLYICSLRCFIFFFGFHKCKYFTVQNDKCIFVDEEDVARRDVYIGPSRTVAPSTQNKKTGSSTSFSYSRKRFSVGISRVCVAPPVVAKSHEMPTKKQQHPSGGVSTKTEQTNGKDKTHRNSRCLRSPRRDDSPKGHRQTMTRRY